MSPELADTVVSDEETAHEESLDSHVERIVQTAPPLSDEQRARLSALLT